MSVHPSLKSGKSKKHKSVLKRLERILQLKKEDRWKKDDPVLGLPKVKVIKLKIKKEKAKAPEAEEAAAAGAAAGGVAAAGAEGAGAKVEAKPEGKEAAKGKSGKEKSA